MVLARVLWPGQSRVAEDGGAEPLAGQQGQLDRQSVVADGMAEGLLGLADPVLDTVLVQDEPLGGGLETAVLLQEDPQGVTQPGVLVIVIGQLPERLVHPGPQELDRARHQGQRRDLGEAGQARSRRTSGQRDRVGAQRLLVGAAEARDTGACGAECGGVLRLVEKGTDAGSGWRILRGGGDGLVDHLPNSRRVGELTA